MPPGLRASPVPGVPAQVGGVFAAALALALLLAAPARAQLREPEVLVVYDSRIADSLLVAEAYAGSAAIPGGVGSVAGAHPAVHAVDLSTLPATGGGHAGFSSTTPNTDYPTFKNRLRDPLRVFLSGGGLTRSIRSIVLTKGLPHRILD